MVVEIDPHAADFSFATLAEQYALQIPPDADGSVVLRPADFILGITAERVSLPVASRLAARVEGRSTLARLGMSVHVTAPTIQSGFSGHITLEITNHGGLSIRLRPGLRVCQLIVEQVFDTPSKAISTAFQNQTSSTGLPKP
jgi:dCTP deaminase